MAGAAILGNGFAARRGMLLVMAAEAAVKIRVPQVIGISPPCHLHGRKHVVLEHSEHGLA